LSEAGITSRRKADTLIKEGRVAVNGLRVTELGTKAVWGKDRIEVDGRAIPDPSPRIYLMLNKPFGIVSTLHDPEGRRVVSDLLTGLSERVYPVGRLDFDSLGLLLLSNDGEWTYRLTHPRFKVPRTYKVTVQGRITDQAVDMLKSGVKIDEGRPCSANTTVISRNDKQSLLRMTIKQGKSRQVRRMLEAVDFRVVHLIRIGFGNLTLGNLKIGQYRHLETEEVEEMKKLVGLD
jgi:23S rRNA pseudouridine2605 synthase